MEIPAEWARGAENLLKRHLAAAFLLPCVFLLLALPARAKININANQDTFVISNEGPGFLVTKLINAGHGADSAYQATLFLASLPGTAALLTPDFLHALAICPSSSEIFTTSLAQAMA